MANVQFIPCFIGWSFLGNPFQSAKHQPVLVWFSISPKHWQKTAPPRPKSLAFACFFSGCFFAAFGAVPVPGPWVMVTSKLSTWWSLMFVIFFQWVPPPMRFLWQRKQTGLFVSKRNAKNQLPLLTNLFSWNLFFARAFGGDSLKGLKIEWIVSTGLMLLWSLADLRTSWYERDPTTPMFFPFLGGRKVHFLHSCRPSICGPPEIHLC